MKNASRAWLLLALPLLMQPLTVSAQNLALTLSVSKTAGIRLGDELLVSATIRNAGPGTADDVFVEVGQAQLEPFLYQLIASESPDCGEVHQVDIDPPSYGFFWVAPSLASDETVTCIARLRVVQVPGNFRSVMYAGTRPHPFTPDPDLSDNDAQIALGFLQPARSDAITVPASSWWSFALAISGVLLAGLCLRRR